MFLGVFVIQWCIGLLIDLFDRAGVDATGAFHGAPGLFLECCLLSYFYFLWAAPHNR